MASLRELPPVHKLLVEPRIASLLYELGQQVVAESCRDVLAHWRQGIQEGTIATVDLDLLTRQIMLKLNQKQIGHFRETINATGIVLHTNLGRAPLAEAAAKAAYEAGRHYLNLELDLDTGERSSRQNPLRKLLCQLTGAESATVVNNCAAATILTLRALALGREVVVSRGQLIEIGGSFRMPEIMATSGAILKEVGATNITRIGDYEKAVGPQTAALMRVHTSNFRVKGFTQDTSLEELVELGNRLQLPVIDDAGSGAIHDPTSYGLAGEPIPQEAIRQGAAVTLFSGDKLLGGPQAGMIAGKKELIQRIEKDPFMRAVRCDKMTLAALERTLQLHLDPEVARREIPVISMLSKTKEELRQKAAGLSEKLMARGLQHDLVEDHAFVGGGTLPEEKLPTWIVRLDQDGSASEWAKRLRTGIPAVLARIERDRILIDTRTVFDEQIDPLVEALIATRPNQPA